MTSVLAKASPKPRSSGGNLGAPERPQVDLLPPEVRAGRGLQRIKRWLALSLVLAVVVAGLGYGWAHLTDQAANDHLAQAQDDAAGLAREKAKYAEVPVVLSAIEDVTLARTFGLSTEVAWTPYVSAIAAVLPAGVSIDSFAVTQGSPLSPALMAGDPLSDAGLGSIVFSARSLTIPDASAWLAALDSIPGFMDPTLQSASITDEEGTVYYSVTSTIQIDVSALTHRFLEGE
ncbi:fimbrial assembly protein [Sanguibacter sp. 25GB23B1]|uniref:PilN domain-containing protein n=1 Tax=unclassified Sanguibacter TaxID=2645534 RepID=UPI0032AFD03C